MKITPKQYARALYESVRGRSEKEAAVAVKKLAGIIVGHNQSSQAGKIADQFHKLWNKDKGIVEAEVTSAHPLDKKAEALIRERIAVKTGRTDVGLCFTVDPKLVGGLVARFDGVMLDLSLANRVKSLKQQLMK